MSAEISSPACRPPPRGPRPHQQGPLGRKFITWGHPYCWVWYIGLKGFGPSRTHLMSIVCNTFLSGSSAPRSHTGLLYSFVLILYGTNENLMARKIGSGLSECVNRDPSGACQECELPFYIYGNVCIIHCPPKYFKDLQKVKTLEKESHNTKRVCAPCHPSCHTCSGDSASNCTSCPLFSTHDKDHWSCSQVDFNKAYSSNAGFAKPPGITLVAAIGIAVSEYVLLYVHLFLTTVP
ncbi:hypothetical protein GDO81_001220 [Engystomops pustulosus]|uniref:Uncharacterized protein n=1 Tax=Engystomops pustulosus TaxID=76066 RepID=A0AAV7DCZ9_ENGPU|nr:hypothetical protein GDO81_001220 [Engystomops pustulosus]